MFLPTVDDLTNKIPYNITKHHATNYSNGSNMFLPTLLDVGIEDLTNKTPYNITKHHPTMQLFKWVQHVFSRLLDNVGREESSNQLFKWV